MAKKNEGKPFHMIASHAQSVPKETVVAFVKSQKVEADSPNFTLMSQTRHPDMKGGGIPHAAVFDHTGTKIYEGHPGQMDAAVEKALRDVPNFYIGEMNFNSGDVRELGRSIETRKQLGKDLGELEKLLAGEDVSDTVKTEATALKDRLITRLDDEKERILNHLGVDPKAALDNLKDLAKELKGSSLGDSLGTLYEEKRNDPVVKESIPVGKKFTALRNEYEKLLKNGKVPAKKQSQVATIVKKLNRLIEKNPELPICESIREFIQEIE